MKLEHIIIVFVMVTLGIGILYGFYANLLDTSGLDTSEAADLHPNEGQYASVYSLEEDMKNKVSESSIDTTAQEDAMLGDMYSAVRSKPYKASDLLSNETMRLSQKLEIIFPHNVFWFITIVIATFTTFAVLYFLRGIKND